MKKLIFLFAMVFAASLVMAQVTSNVAETEQDGNQNNVIIKQIGNENEAESHQYGNQNGASVLQTGNENVGVADQLRGDRNTADVKQEGNLNEGYIQQGLTSDYYVDYVPSNGEVPPAYNLYANDNDADVVQIGYENFSSVGQWGNNNTGSSVQNGDNNVVYIYQGWEGTWWGGPALYSTNSKVDIKQYQNGNDARVWQYGGNNNTTNVLQDGLSNLVSVTQGWIYTDLNYDFTNPVLNTKNNFVSINQTGNENKAKMMQLGDNNLFKLTQNGDGNEVGYFAGSLEPSRNAYFTQDGNNNKFAGVYINANNDLSFWESQDAEQNNGATLDYQSYQKGDYNTIGLRQGMDDWALIQQDGIGNVGLLYQYGADQNQATMIQDGNYNTSQIVQIQQ
jgi:hypothetical protein